MLCIAVASFSLCFQNTLAEASGFKPKKSNSTCFFGAYEQDGNIQNGKEPIEWIVLMADEDSYYLLSREILDVVMYNQTRVDVTWETCSLRSWLNSTFLNNAFIASEQSKLYSVCIEKNSGNEVWDKAFCLSEEEALSFLPEKADRIAYPTVYVMQNPDYTNGNGPGAWWLRSSSTYNGFIRTVSDVWTSGEIGVDNIRCATIGVRPVICAQKEAVSFKKPDNREAEQSPSGSFSSTKKTSETNYDVINGTKYYIPAFGCTFTCPSNWNPFIRDLTDEQYESYGLMREFVTWCLDSLGAEFGASNYDYGAVMSAYATPNGTDINLKEFDDTFIQQFMDAYIKAIDPDGAIGIKNPNIVHTADNCYIRYEFTTNDTLSSFYIAYVTFLNQSTYEFAFSNQHAYTKELTSQIESIIRSIRWDAR